MTAITISNVHPDPLGPDRENNKNVKLNQEWITIKNTGNEPFKLDGRYLVDRTGTNQHRHKILFSTDPAWTLAIGQTLTIFTGKKGDVNDPDTAVDSNYSWHLEYTNYIWNNTGDTAEIYASKDDFYAEKEPLAKRTF
jgi:hypothetical protein